MLALTKQKDANRSRYFFKANWNRLQIYPISYKKVNQKLNFKLIKKGREII